MLVDFIVKLIKGIVMAFVYGISKFCQGIIYLFVAHTKGMLMLVISFLLAITTVMQSKYGFFINYKETTINNDFKKPCKVVIIKDTEGVKKLLKKK